ncbi:Phosphoglucose isomerase (PGI), partial [mine drainage metagenome]
MGRFPAYLQQLMMESNGKSVKLDGSPVSCQTGEVYWGEPGTDGQHAFYQLLHQGTKLVPVDIILFANSTVGDAHAHQLLFANGAAQAAVLALGRSPEELAAEGVPADLVPHKMMPGNRPSSVIVAPKLTPAVLGELVAL